MTKYIIVPKNKDAEKALDYDQAIDSDLIILTIEDNDFQSLWKVGIFNQINDLADVVIDVYEDERITDVEALNLVYNSDLFSNERYGQKEMIIITQLKDLFKEAIQRETGFYFYF